jgi:four helix bundle protein
MDENGYGNCDSGNRNNGDVGGSIGRLPHHKLRVFWVAQDLVVAVRDARVRDAHLRDQALRAAKSAMLNIGEGAGRVGPADKAHKFAIARGEAVEACAAVETAAVCGDAPPGAAAEVVRLAAKLYAMLTPLARAR